MKTSTSITAGMAVALVLLTGAWAGGQSKKDAKKGTSGGNPPAASQAGTASASGQKAKSGGNMQSVQSNPMYKENQNPGSMPQSESRDSVDKGPAGTQPASPEDARYRPGNNKTTTTGPAGAASTVEYKDPEDMTTRYRPGNNKTTTTEAPGAASPGAASTVEYKDPEDMTTRYRPGNNKATTTPTTGAASTVEYKDPEDMTTRYRPGNNKTTKAPATGSKAPADKTQSPN